MLLARWIWQPTASGFLPSTKKLPRGSTMTTAERGRVWMRSSALLPIILPSSPPSTVTWTRLQSCGRKFRNSHPVTLQGCDCCLLTPLNPIVSCSSMLISFAPLRSTYPSMQEDLLTAGQGRCPALHMRSEADCCYTGALSILSPVRGLWSTLSEVFVWRSRFIWRSGYICGGRDEDCNLRIKACSNESGNF